MQGITTARRLYPSAARVWHGAVAGRNRGGDSVSRVPDRGRVIPLHAENKAQFRISQANPMRLYGTR